MTQLKITNEFQTQTTYKNVSRNAFMVGQVKSTAKTPRLAGSKDAFHSFEKIFSQTCNIRQTVASYLYTSN